MFSLFKKHPALAEETTWKSRVERFWEWFAQQAPRFYEAIETKEVSSIGPKVSDKVEELMPGFAWEFGPGDHGNGHSFTLSGEGNPHRQLLTIYWCQQAPKLDGWTFYPARQPSPIQGMQMHIGERVFDPIEFWLTPSVDREREKVDLTIWHPLFDHLEEKDRWMGVFLFLDQVLGEYGTQQWVGEIKLNNQRLGNSMPMHELPEFIKKVEADTGWKKYPPGESGVVYRCNEPHDRFPRGDVIVGSTSQPALIHEYLAAEGELEDPLAGTGADYVFVSFDASILPKGRETEARGAIEDALEQALGPAKGGRVIGGAHGRNYAYIDLLLFDGHNSLEIVQRVLREKGMPERSSINFFAKEKHRHQRL